MNERVLSTRLRAVSAYAASPEEEDLFMENLSSLSQESEENPLREYLRTIVTYRWLIFSVTLVLLALSLLYSFLATPLYTAEAKLKISTYAPLLAGTQMENVLVQQTREQDYLETQAKLLTSLTLADRALSEGQLESQLDSYFKRQTGLLSVFGPLFRLFQHSQDQQDVKRNDASDYRYPVRMLRSYLSLLKITPIRRTSLVTVAARTADPELSARVANAHSKAFIDYVRAERQQATLENLVFLKGQEEELAGKVALAERELAAYAEDNAIVSLNKDENIVVKRMAELSEMLTQSTAVRIRSETAYNEAKSGSGLTSTVLDDDSIQELRFKLEEAQSEYDMLSQKFKPAYPKMVQLRARIDSLKQGLSGQRTQALATLKARYESDLKSEDELKKQLEVQKSKAFELSRREVQYNIMKREYETLRDLHQSVIRQLKEAQISAESQGSNISIADRAAVPLTHSSPRRGLNFLLALFVGPFVGFAVALVIETLDNTMKTPEEVERYLHLPSLGVIPAFGADDLSSAGSSAPRLPTSQEVGEAKNISPAAAEEAAEAASAAVPACYARDIVTLNAPSSVTSESFRSIRTGILLSSADNPPKIILVTSGKKAEGKTTVISNLAITLAQTAQKVLVIDADLRRPSVHSLFPLDPNAAGLVDCLTAQRPLDEVIHSCGVKGLFIIPAGQKPPNPAELLGSRKMVEMLEELSKQFDYVLIDTPPVLPVTDAVMLSRLVDGVILVVRGQETQRDIAASATARLRQVGARMLGVVLNDINVRSGQYYYYYRDTYADYYADDQRTLRRRKTTAC